MVITIDGPAGTGKSTVALAVAERLGFDFLDTGAMYRALGLEALNRNMDLEDGRELAYVARFTKITFDWAKHPAGVLLNGKAVGHLLRGSETTRAASKVAVVGPIRDMFVQQQRQIAAERGNVVTEGRDQGTIAFPNAELKIYLDAAPAERAPPPGRPAARPGREGRLQRDPQRHRHPRPPRRHPHHRAAGGAHRRRSHRHHVPQRAASGEPHRDPRRSAGQNIMSDPIEPTQHGRPIVYDVGQVLCRIFTSTLLDLKVYGAENVPAQGGALLLANHQSYLDPVLIGVQLPRRLSFLAKSELFESKAFGWLIRSLNAYPIRQGAGDVGAMRETIKQLNEGRVLNIFPEGTRTETGELQPLQPGFALVVRKTKVPVIPVAIEGSYEAWPKENRMPHSSPVKVMYGPAMHLHELRPAEIVARVDEKLKAMIAELRTM